MTYEAFTSDDFAPFDRGGVSRKIVLQTVPGAIALALSALMGAYMLYGRPAETMSVGFQQIDPAPATPAVPAALPGGALISKALRANAPSRIYGPVPLKSYGALLDPTFALGHAPLPFAQSFPLRTNFEAAPKPAAPPIVIAAIEQPHAVPPLPAATPPAPAPVAENTVATPDVPMPMPRPQFRPAPSETSAPTQGRRRMAQQLRQPSAQPVAPGAPAEQPSFFEKLFGGTSASKPQGTALAYAAPEDGILGTNVLRRNPAARVPAYDQYTAVYDISAHTVYLPDGTRLEAHSGLGDRFDDPRAVTEKMRGPTPPAVYELTLREALFHGVQALRLTPISGDTFGRTGLLAHRFMLGPRGDSNGCVSFRNYEAFLQAYTSGRIRHLVVVASLH